MASTDPSSDDSGTNDQSTNHQSTLDNSSWTTTNTPSNSEDDDTSENTTTEKNSEQADQPTRTIDPDDALATGAASEQLGDKQLVLFDRILRNFETWMLDVGRNPAQMRGMAPTSVENTIWRIDQIYRTLWYRTDTIVLVLTHDLADAYNEWLAEDDLTTQTGEPYSPASKNKDNEALQKYFEWRAEEHDVDRWEPTYTFDEPANRPADEFVKKERRKLRESTLEYKTIPKYDDLSPEDRDRWKQYIAMRLEKPKEDVVPADWERINCSWKIPCLFYIALDTGLRPIEVKRSSVDWLRLDKEALYIPKNKAAKNREHWEVAIRADTVEVTEFWLQERAHRAKYDDTDAIWLTREGNPYGSDALNYTLNQLLETAGIDQEIRKLCWYSIRHSVGDALTSEGGLQQTKEQLRHRSLSSTLKYQSPTLDDRQDSLERMG